MACAAVFTSCNKEHWPLMDGTYSGTYTMTYPNGDTQVWDVSLTLNGNEFILSDGDENTIPAHGSIDCWGKFYIKRKNIAFECEPQIVLALYLKLPTLGGECDYTFDGRRLNLSRIPGEDEGYTGGSFRWNLVRQ
jgi:hypothetical protein